MQAPYMKIVKLPESVRYLKSWKGADQLWSDLNSRFKLSVYISYANDALWVRENFKSRAYGASSIAPSIVALYRPHTL